MKMMFECLECGSVFKKSIPKSLEVKCPDCGGYDIEPAGEVGFVETGYYDDPDYGDYGGAFDGIGSVFSDADPGL